MLVRDDLGDDGLGSLLLGEGGIEVVEVGILGRHEVHPRGVVYLIAPLLGTLRIVDPVRLDLKLLHTLPQLHILRTLTSHPDNILTELPQVGLQLPGTVPLGVHRHKHQFELEVGALRQIPNDPVDRGEVVEGTGADVGTGRVPKIDEVVITRQVSAGKGLAVGVGQRPIAPDQRLLLLELLETRDVVLDYVEVLVAPLAGGVVHVGEACSQHQDACDA